MIHHTRAVLARGPSRAQPVSTPADLRSALPEPNQAGPDSGCGGSRKVLKETAAAAVSLEGAEPETPWCVVDRLVRSGIR